MRNLRWLVAAVWVPWTACNFRVNGETGPVMPGPQRDRETREDPSSTAEDDSACDPVDLDASDACDGAPCDAGPSPDCGSE